MDNKALIVFHEWLKDQTHVSHPFVTKGKDGELVTGLVIGESGTSFDLSYDDDPWHRRIWQRVPILFLHRLPHEVRVMWWDLQDWFRAY